MKKVYLCIICVLLFILNILSFKYYNLYKSYNIINEKYTQELKNVKSLENAIKLQNETIENYKEKSSAIMKEVEDLNKKISEFKKPEYITIEKEKVNNDEAIEWLRKKASGF